MYNPEQISFCFVTLHSLQKESVKIPLLDHVQKTLVVLYSVDSKKIEIPFKWLENQYDIKWQRVVILKALRFQKQFYTHPIHIPLSAFHCLEMNIQIQ